MHLLIVAIMLAGLAHALQNGTNYKPYVQPYPYNWRNGFQQEANTIWIGSQRFSAGFDLDRGGVMTYFSDYTTGSGNVIDSFDTGRSVQQSYYGDPDGSTWNGQPWVFNPVQGGNWRNEPGRVDAWARANDWTWFKTTSTPRNWGGLQMLENVKMYQWAQFPTQDVMQIAFSMRYTGGAYRTQARHQEIPALFFNRRFGTLVVGDMYSGNYREFPSIPGTNWYMIRDGRLNYRKFWAAWVDGTGSQARGVGFYVAEANDLTAYRVANVGQPGACVYASPLMTSVMPEFFAYNVYMTIAEIQRRLMALPK